MAQHYSNPKRANDAHALPNVETFREFVGECTICDAQSLAPQGVAVSDLHCDSCNRTGYITSTERQAWWFWFCFPGCMPDSEAHGPYDTEREALADARLYEDDDDSDESEEN